MRDCFLAELLISGLIKKKYHTTLLFALARVMIAQPRWPANGQSVRRHFNYSKRLSVGVLFSPCYASHKFERFSAAVKVSAIQNVENVARKVVKC